jgi:anti-sigma-K factor RskA
MNTELTHDQILELLPAYALGALEPEEMLAVDNYLNQNRTLLDRLHQAELAAAQMAYAAPDVPVPVTAKSQLLSRVRADLATQAAAPPEAILTAPPAAPTRLAPPKLVTPTPLPSEGWWAGLRRVFGSTTGWAVAAGCALIALVILGFYLTQLQSQLKSLQAEVSQLQTTNTELQETNTSLQQQLLENQTQLQQASAELDSVQTQVAELQTANTDLQRNNKTLQQQTQANQELLALVAGPNLKQTVPLSGTEEALAAGGTFYLGGDNQAALVLHGLKPLPANQTYQLWLIPAGGDPAPAGLLAVQTDSPTWVALQVPADAPQDFSAVGVSVEPAGGSPAPTGPIVLLGSVS